MPSCDAFIDNDCQNSFCYHLELSRRKPKNTNGSFEPLAFPNCLEQPIDVIVT